MTKKLRFWLHLLLFCGCFAALSCKDQGLRVAVIPRTTAFTIWEAAHAGAQFAAAPAGIQVYWNAPASEDDIQEQSALVDRVIDQHYEGLILAPDQPLALLAPVERAVAKGIHTVIIASPLSMPPRPNVAYIVNDDQAIGHMAAARIADILHGHGRVAVLGINPQSLSDLDILHSFESTLEERSPGITIIDRRTGTHNLTEAQQIAEDVLALHHDLDAVFTLSAIASYGTINALQSDGNEKTKVIGFEQSVELANDMREGVVDSLIAEDTYQMGYQAMQLLSAHRSGVLPPENIQLQPVLLTRENIDSPQARNLVNMDWARTP
ncbi:MAG TPA: substrate-binding domain-containing protein [Alloacidobacterium sp.]|nr:substrate-binding domain-containing protein [Alloacidobacterium sp.]